MKKLLLVLFLAACGKSVSRSPVPVDPTVAELSNLRNQIFALQGTQSQINALVLSDYSTCKALPTDGGSTNNALIKKICDVAQASTIESKVELQGQLATLSSFLSTQISDLQTRLDDFDAGQHKADLYGTGTSCATATAGSLCVQVATLTSSLATLDSRVTAAEGNITTLNSSVAAINSSLSTVVNGAMFEITIGNENVLAGPVYESLLRKGDRSRINGYINANSPNASFSSNPCTTVNGSPTITLTKTSHGLTVGDTVQLGGLTSCRGIPGGAMNDSYTVVTTPTANTFTVLTNTAATSSGTGGGSNGYFTKIVGRGLGQVWVTANGETTATTSAGKAYNILITGASTSFTVAPGGTLPAGWGGLTPGAGFVCYSITNLSASAATIKAGGANVRCK